LIDSKDGNPLGMYLASSRREFASSREVETDFPSIEFEFFSPVLLLDLLLFFLVAKQSA